MEVLRTMATDASLGGARRGRAVCHRQLRGVHRKEAPPARAPHGGLVTQGPGRRRHAALGTGGSARRARHRWLVGAARAPCARAARVPQSTGQKQWPPGRPALGGRAISKSLLTSATRDVSICLSSCANAGRKGTVGVHLPHRWQRLSAKGDSVLGGGHHVQGQSDSKSVFLFSLSACSPPPRACCRAAGHPRALGRAVPATPAATQVDASRLLRPGAAQRGRTEMLPEAACAPGLTCAESPGGGRRRGPRFDVVCREVGCPCAGAQRRRVTRFGERFAMHACQPSAGQISSPPAISPRPLSVCSACVIRSRKRGAFVHLI